MSLESGPWLMSCDAIDPKKGHVPDNLRLVCLYNNPPDHSKQNKDLTNTDQSKHRTPQRVLENCITPCFKFVKICIIRKY
jgi:hypothetical protein